MNSFKRKNLAGGLVELNKSKEPDHSEWIPIEFGILVFQKDYGKQSYYFRLYDLESNTKSNEYIWEYEMYNPFAYSELDKNFHYFAGEGFYIGFNFSNIEHAEKFFEIVIKIAKAREELYNRNFKRNKKIESNTSIKSRSKTKKYSIRKNLIENSFFANLFKSKKTKNSKIDSKISADSVSKEEKNLSNNSLNQTDKPNEYSKYSTSALSFAKVNQETQLNSLDSVESEVSHKAPLPPPLPKKKINTALQCESSPMAPMAIKQTEVSVSNHSQKLEQSFLNEIENFNLKKLKKTKTVDKSAFNDSIIKKTDKMLEKNDKLEKINQSLIETAKPSKSEFDKNQQEKLKEESRNNLKVELVEKPTQIINASLSHPPPAPPPPPPPASLIISKSEKVKIPNRNQEEKAPVIDSNQALMESIRSFKGFKKKDQQKQLANKQLPKLELKDQLKDVLAMRKAFLNQSSEDSNSDVEW